MDNPIRFIVGGVRVDLPIEIGLGEARTRLAEKTVDPITALFDASPPARAQSYLLVGFADPDRIRLHTPNYARWPLWLLAPVLRGELVQSEADCCILRARLFIRRWVMVVGALVSFLGISLASPPFNWEAGTLVVLWLLELLFALPRTKRQLLERVSAALSAETPTITAPSA